MESLKRILFVDDHQALLNALRHALRPHRGEWEMEFVGDGNTALAAMAAKPFDVIVSDLQLPDIDGVQLLDQVRAQYPQTARLMLCAVAGPDDVCRAAPVVHQLLPKPYPVPKLESAIEQTLQAHASLKQEALRRWVGGVSDLPMVPPVYVELCQAVSRPDCDVAKLAAIVRRDVAVSAKVLQLASSAYFGHAVSTLEAAVFFVGVELLKAMALSTQVFTAGNDDASLPPGLRVSEISRSAERAVKLVRQLAPRPALEEASVSALLRDLGTLLLLDRAPDMMIEAASRARRQQVPRTTVERELFGVTHADVGAYLLALWGLPSRIVGAVAQHHQPAVVAADAASAVALASQIVDHVMGHVTELEMRRVDPEWIRWARID